MYETLKFKIQGVAPLLMHNAQLANPLNPIVKKMKEITAKGKKKTDHDIEELSRLEFMGGLYVNDKSHPVVTGECIEGMIRGGARKSRSGMDVESGIICESDWPLIYDGPKTADKLWEDKRFVDFRSAGIKKSRIMRTRPRFDQWELEFEIMHLPEICNASDVQKWLADAAIYVGLCDYRPRFGRFAVC